MHQDDTYTGPDRRKKEEPTLDAIWILLLEVDSKFSAHMEEEKQIKPAILELVDILQKSKGVLIFFRLLLYIGAPLTAIIYWLKDHVKL